MSAFDKNITLIGGFFFLFSCADCFLKQLSVILCCCCVDPRSKWSFIICDMLIFLCVCNTEESDCEVYLQLQKNEL